MHKWLGYSVQLDGCLCLPCCLFGSDAENAKNLVQKPVSNWTTFNEKVKIHSASSTHTKCALAMTAFIDTHSGVQPTIDTSLSKHRQELYRLNCKRLDAIIDSVLLCGQQNIALRGHCDANSQPKGLNKGNFKAILEFRALGDPVLQEHLASGPKKCIIKFKDTERDYITLQITYLAKDSRKSEGK